ncbi:uncharacterized protein LOC126898343 [Daktulosphaira vitifoliae]|uniref:uncharacterized protein LOC126898343 n=1 Tax=Daktulosphaira vitifoliae TaxID=58002 RepID=UPI0021AA202D|nr:uncharacterized protein LOC126898343 [Daktulosphaira vitifoliae]
MEGHHLKNTGTVPGVSETPGPAGKSAVAGSTRSSSSDCIKAVGLVRQGPGGVRAQATVGGCAKQASSSDLRVTEVTAGGLATIEEMVDDWEGVRERFRDDMPLTQSEFTRWNGWLQSMETGGSTMDSFPCGSFRAAESFRSSVSTVLKLMKRDLDDGSPFAPERIKEYNPLEGVDEPELRAELIEKCIASRRGEAAVERLTGVARLVASELLSRYNDSGIMRSMVRGLYQAVEYFAYTEGQIKQEVTSPLDDEDEMMRTGDRRGSGEPSPEEGSSTRPR